MGELEKARDYISRAVENCPGHEKLVVLEEEFCSLKELDWRRILFPALEEEDGGEGEGVRDMG